MLHEYYVKCNMRQKTDYKPYKTKNKLLNWLVADSLESNLDFWHLSQARLNLIRTIFTDCMESCQGLSVPGCVKLNIVCHTNMETSMDHSDWDRIKNSTYPSACLTKQIFKYLKSSKQLAYLIKILYLYCNLLI